MQFNHINYRWYHSASTSKRREMTDTTEGSSATLRAFYHSPTGDEIFSHKILSLRIENGHAVDTQAKTKYLSDLRASSKTLQDEINRFLTGKMEEDKKSADHENKSSVSKQKAADELEEANYGEEAVEDEC